MQLNSRDLWSTPQSVIDSLSKDLGQGPILDLAADPSSAKAPYYITPTLLNINHEMDIQPLTNGIFSLSPEWIAFLTSGGWCWLNPPYSRGNMDRFCEWAAKCADNGAHIAICHRPDLSTAWFQTYILPRLDILYIPSRRIHFLPPEGIPASAPNFAAVISLIGGPQRGITKPLDIS